MTPRDEMLRAVRRQLAVDLNCLPGDLMGEKDTFIFCQAKENPGRRPFPREASHFQMLSMGGPILVSATPDILHQIKAQMDGKSRDDAFALPFVYGHSLYFLPDSAPPPAPPEPAGFSYQIAERGDMEELYRARGFHNAVSYDKDHIRPDVLAHLAKKGDQVVAVAGASADCADMWQIGIDVLPACRGRGLAAYLVFALARDIIKRGLIPYYGTASSNIASQRVAHRAGFVPAWICAYRGRFGDMFTGPTS